jgi:hypothetical protein
MPRCTPLYLRYSFFRGIGRLLGDRGLPMAAPDTGTGQVLRGRISPAAAFILRGEGDGGEGQADDRDLSVAAVLPDTIAGAAAAAGVAATGAIILATHGW